MNAGQAIGLLAGLGALNALRGGRDGAGPRFTGLLDMIDGGGAGRSGDRFEGGGLLSALGNLFAKPYEAQDRVERIATDARSANGGMTLRPRARPEMVSRNNVEPIDAYGLMATPAAPETYVNPYSVGGGFRETAPLPMNYAEDFIGDIFDRAESYQRRPTDVLDADPRIRAEFKLNRMFQGGPVYPDDPEMTNQDYLALLPPNLAQMVRPEGSAAGMPRALPSMVRPEGLAAGMPAAPTQMVRPEGPAAGMPQAPVQRYADPTQDPLFMQFMARQVDPKTFEVLYTGRSGERNLQRQYEAYLSFMMAKEGRG